MAPRSDYCAEDGGKSARTASTIDFPAGTTTILSFFGAI